MDSHSIDRLHNWGVDQNQSACDASNLVYSTHVGADRKTDVPGCLNEVKRDISIVTVLVGDGGVGKTALAARLLGGEPLSYPHGPTIQGSYKHRLKEHLILEITDTAGADGYSSLREDAIQEGDCFVLVVDLSRLSTYEYAEMLVSREMRGKLPNIIVGNMSGKASAVAALNKKLNRKERLLLQHKYTVAEKKVAEKARALAERTGCPYVEVHFNHEEKVDDVFLRALDDLENKQMRFLRLLRLRVI
ncbi:small G-protein Ras2 [Apiospora kogelbergensis]|uniref:Small G-protein Ras2 n=1 Tax=Apiospora kogelbergensis TaxID=1337665 RepID=A0AAW0QZF0_9PEZI